MTVRGNIYISENVFNGAVSGPIHFLAPENPLKIMKNASYFTLKGAFVFKIFRFCLYVFVLYKNELIRKIRLISKFMTPQPG